MRQLQFASQKLNDVILLGVSPVVKYIKYCKTRATTTENNNNKKPCKNSNRNPPNSTLKCYLVIINE